MGTQLEAQKQGIISMFQVEYPDIYAQIVEGLNNVAPAEQPIILASSEGTGLCNG